MESCRNLFINNHMSSSNNDNSTNINDARAIWTSRTTPPRIDWSNPLTDSFHQATTTAATNFATSTPHGGEGVVHALMVKTHAHLSPFSTCLYSGNSGGGGGCGSQYPDPHLMCLKLGKRHYFGDTATPFGDRQGLAVGLSIDNAASNGITIGDSKRGKPYYELVGGTPTSSSGVTVAAAAPTGVVPRCQVDGCQVALLDAKDYHRRHKVCEMHSKAPKVVVLGLEQRFCQQCSRFHAVGEFDESKRSCRRRLAGHNERRRKSSQEQSTPRSQSHQVNRKLMTYGGRRPHFPLSNGCALSLLSSKNDSWVSSSDLPARCSAALRELIAENRAAILARQLILDKDWQWHHHHHQPTEGVSNSVRQNGSISLVNYQQHMGSGTHSWDRIAEAGGHVTLDLMQAPTSAFGFLSVRGKSKEDEDCPELWGSFS